VQVGAPLCVTVKIWPATIIVPVRVLLVGFEATEKLTGPLPLALLPAVTVIQGTLFVAIQTQPAAAVT
jgi:hypothetical protein